MPLIDMKIECPDCKATGLYVGFAEKHGCAVVCHSCKGTGCFRYKYTYEPFEERKLKKGVKRVFKNSCGYGHSSNDVTLENGTVIKFSKGGVEYDKWLSGSKPKPVKDLYCPYLWESQGLQNSDHPQHQLYKARCDSGLSLGGTISNCKFFCEKSKCWDKYEQLGGK